MTEPTADNLPPDRPTWDSLDRTPDGGYFKRHWHMRDPLRAYTDLEREQGAKVAAACSVKETP